MTYELIAETLLSQSWKIAKTMPNNPHEYTLRMNWANDPLFDQVVQYIRANGEDFRFGKTTYKVLKLNGMRYWTIGAPIEKTILINRAEHFEATDYDLIAPKYDSIFADQKSINEEVDLFDLLDIKGRVLDIGCGTGMFLDHMVGFFTDYVGIDPSKNMIEIAAQKHRYLSNVQFFNCKLEHFSLGKFDTIVALFGSASYLSNIKRPHKTAILDMLAPGGTAYLMYYGQGYFPVTYQKSGIDLHRSHHTPQWTPDDGAFSIGDFNNYSLVTVKK